jgi:hypothetical protein
MMMEGSHTSAYDVEQVLTIFALPLTKRQKQLFCALLYQTVNVGCANRLCLVGFLNGEEPLTIVEPCDE